MLLRFVSLICIAVFALKSTPGLSQSKIDFKNPPAEPAVLYAGIISTGLSERDFALSPDGKEMFYTIQSPQPGRFQTIVYRKKDAKGNWSKPQLAPFAGKFSDLEPAFSPDGSKLYFASNRPLTGENAKDFDIWMIEKDKNGWVGTPKNLGAPVNTESDEFYPSITLSGNLYYTATYKSSNGGEDIFMCKWENGKYSNPVPLDTAVNSKGDEFNAFISPDEKIILFTTYRGREDKGKGDLCMSMKNEAGQWQPAKRLSGLNTSSLEYCPFISFDGKILFFTSTRNKFKPTYQGGTNYDALISEFTSSGNGGGDIYWIDFNKVLEFYNKK